MSRSVIVYSLVLGLGILGICAGLSSLERSAHAANGIPDCEDGLDNDGDGLVDFPADPGCSSLEDPSELNALIDAGPQQFDLSLADLSTDVSTDMGNHAHVADAGLDGGSTSMQPGPTTSAGSGTASNVQQPAGSGGCDVGDGQIPTAPIVIVLAVAGGLMLTRRSEV
ncbi:MAG: hypothetical protein ABI321_24900 [Polyangia bacterium]